ncbi:arginine--tRNA ligase [Acutalibacter muris]|jgi:arginyl-tRNA synthetase|uniref:arginine--tRNA ligase n=1 Tax=Acutalibacter muris TaxID=1796620 RepID=UPI0026F3DB62|nr:arginine--tRNA ligase [Acutalibacter muris]
MSQLVETARQQLRGAVLAAIEGAIAAGELPKAPVPEFALEVPGDRAHGDWACNAAMAGARAFHAAPRKIAEAITAHLNLEGTFFTKCEIAGPGFLNFTYDPAFYGRVLMDIESLGDGYGRSDVGKGKRVLVEYVSANPTGPMHIGNARGGVLGDALSAVLEAAGYQVEREFYVNDAGNQVNRYGLSIEARYMQHFEPGFPFPEDGYKGKDVTANAEAFIEEHGDKYVDRPSEERRQALISFAIPRNIQGLHDDLKRYRVEYDTWFHESGLHESGAVDRVVELMREKGLTYEKEGATWFRGSEYGSEDFVLLRSNGVPTYVVPDIAYHYNKLVTRGFDTAINVLGADHHGYVPRLKAAIAALGIDPERLKVVLMQMVTLMRDGKPEKMSKRSGEAITMANLLEEVPVDAARFLFNSYEPNTRIDFDLDLAVKEDSQNPVYYVQYAHARICSILRNLAEDGISPRPCTSGELALLTAPEEIELIRLLSNFTDEIAGAARAMDPARITRYVLNVGTLFHKFYNACRVKGVEPELTAARLCLCTAAKTVLENGLALFKVSAPERM